MLAEEKAFNDCDLFLPLWKEIPPTGFKSLIRLSTIAVHMRCACNFGVVTVSTC
jgi:hypothetical protein